MKKSIYKLIMPCVLILTAISCKKDFLTVVPKGQQVAVTTNDYSLLMNNLALYETFAGGWQAAGIMGDDVAAEAVFFNSAQSSSQQAFRWGDNLYKPGDIDWDLTNWLSNLYTVNKVANEVLTSTKGTDEQKKAIQAEALAMRAWLYFQFVNYYGKPYVASTATTDPAFPIVTAADITVKNFSRSSVQDVYKFIIRDLTTAITSLPVENVVGPTRFSKAAAEGILGKVYLFMGKNTDALNMLKAALVDNAAKGTPARLYDYNKEFAPGGKFLPITTNGPNNSPEQDYTDVTESIMSNNFYNGVFAGNGFGADFIVLSAQARALFNTSDFRLNFYGPYFLFGNPNPSGRLAKFNSYSGPYVKYGLQLAELYLLNAEVKARLNDLTGAKADVETLRKNRMPVTDATVPAVNAASQTALLQFIFDEREREFATQGYRWFDMRRMSVDPLFTPQTYKHTLYLDSTKTNTTTFTLNPIRLTQRLPLFIMNANPQIQNNP